MIMADALRNLVSEDDCIKASLTEMKLEPADNDLDIPQVSGARKADKIRAILTESVSPESHRTVESILEQVHKLSTLDKLLLYLKLPTGRPAEACDPLRQPLNPLGSRSEIQLTINWIRSHYEEDPQVSLPKHEVYDDYSAYCSINTVKPLSTADFGKVMKQVFPAVRPRRLGTRGNSRYCYAGLRKRIKLDTPVTPDISAEPGRSRDSLVGSEEEVGNAAGFLIREWVEKLLGVKFDNLPDLACFLLEKMYVDNRSVAAFTLLSRAGKFDIKAGSMPPMPPTNGTDSKLQLQRKLQEVNMKTAEQHKRKLVEQEMGVGKRSKLSEEATENYDVNLNYDGGVVGNAVGVLQGDTKLLADNQNRYSVVVQNNQNNQQLDPVFINGNNGMASFDTSVATAQGTSGEFQVSYNGDRIEAVMAGPGARQVTSSSISLDKLPRKKQVVLVGGGDLNNGLSVSSVTSVIKAGEKPRSKYKEEVGEMPGPEVWPREAVTVDQEPGLVTQYDSEPADLSALRNWSGGSSGPDTEEELVQYFSNQEIGDPENTESEKLSQIRQLLTKNLTPIGVSQPSGGAFKRTFREPGKLDPAIISSAAEAMAVASSIQTDSGHLSTRRRVSFHPLIVSDADAGGGSGGGQGAISCPVPPSPGTRRRHFSFQPISPRAQGPGQSPPASPFISPRSTPVHMLRSRHSSGSALPLHLLPGGNGRQQHPSGGSDISRAATFGSASESSTPFISPMGTPVPFAMRSRHNSASGRLCGPRSRHGSGVPLERQFSRQYSGNNVQSFSGNDGGLESRQYSNATAPYSPMALNNLNNPFSPQPAQILDMSDPMVTAQYPGGQATVPGPQGPQFVRLAAPGTGCGNNGGMQNSDRSRHSSAGSDGPQSCHARSAPMSPFNDSNVHNVRQRHVSAGHVPVSSSHTIHYRPGSEFDSPAPGPGQFGNYPNQVATANNGDTVSHHSSYRNTPVPQEFQTEAEADFNGLMSEESAEIVTSVASVAVEGGPGGENKINNDDIDLALDALRNCDTDFIGFDAV